MARFIIRIGPSIGLLGEANARREEQFKVFFTLEPHVPNPSRSTKLRPFRVYVCVDQLWYRYVDYQRDIWLRPLLNDADYLMLKGTYNLISSPYTHKGELTVDTPGHRVMPIDWLGLSPDLRRPLERAELKTVGELAASTDSEIWDLYVKDALAPGYPMSSTVACGAAALVRHLKERIDLLTGLPLPGWKHTETDLAQL